MKKVRREDKQIENLTFHIPKLGVQAQRRLLFKLAALIGMPVGDLLGQEAKAAADGESGEEKPFDLDKLWGSLGTALTTLADPKSLKLYEDIINTFKGDFKKGTGTEVTYEHENGEMATAALEGDVYENIFDQRLDLEAAWVWACLEVNYSSFLGKLKGIVAAAKTSFAAAAAAQVAESDSESPPDVTG